MDAPRLPNGRVDWDTILRRYGTDMDMTYARTLKWASERDSLQVVAELVGFSVVGGAHGQKPSSTSMELLNSLGTFLDRKGYKVPSMWAPTSAQIYIGKNGPELPAEHLKKVSKAKQTVVTREKYLDMRLSGMNRTQCGKELGISSPTLYRRLIEWGLREPEAEELLLAAMKKGQPVKEPLSIEVGVTTVPVQDKPVNECYVTLRIPIAVVEWPEQVRALSEKVLDRDTMIRVGVTCLQNAAAWARRDLVDILGDEAVTQRLQAFMERKCQVG